MTVISSRQHPLCKTVRALHSGKGRKKHNLYLIEGGHAIGAALQARVRLQQLLVTPDRLGREWQQLAAWAGVETTWVEDNLFSYLSEAQNAPDVLAIAPLPPVQNAWNDDGLSLILDGVSDPGNAGTLLRAADAAGVVALTTTANSVDLCGPKVVRAAAGSSFHFARLNGENQTPQEHLQVLAERKIPIITAEAHDGEDAFAFAWPRRCALILGHETRGVSEEFSLAAQAKVTIPIYGRAESLNVAMAGTLLMYAWRQKQ